MRPDDDNAEHRIRMALIELAYTLNTPLKVDLAILFRRGAITRQGEIKSGDDWDWGAPFVGADSAEMMTVANAVIDFDSACERACGVNCDFPLEDELESDLRKIIRRFGSAENARLAEHAITTTLEHLSQGNGKDGFSLAELDYMLYLSLRVGCFTTDMINYAKEMSK